jgi:hypothetical protein
VGFEDLEEAFVRLEEGIDPEGYMFRDFRVSTLRQDELRQLLDKVLEAMIGRDSTSRDTAYA